MSDFDLFGNLVRYGRGRPKYQVTDEKRNKLMLLLAAGWDMPRIEAAMGACEKTLNKYFSSELKLRTAALDRLEAQRMFMLFEKASEGDTSAIKELGKLVEKLRAAEADRMFDGHMPPSEKAKPLGKKEEQQQEAESVGGIFAPPDGPTLQ